MAEAGKPVAYLRQLDGLRAVAILAVVTAHAGLPQLGGYLGVTLFFVISGFLITRLLVAELEGSGRIRLGAFYRRRFARLGPALALILLVTLGWLLASGVPTREWWAGLVGTATYTTDFVLVSPGRTHVSDFFRWSWSLSIEEQFYLVWPMLLLLTYRFGRRVTAAVAALLAAAVVVDRSVPAALHYSHERLFYSLDTHADSILIGCVIALLPLTRGRRVTSWVAALVGVALLVRVYANPQPLWHWDHGTFTVATIASAAVILSLVTAPPPPLQWALSLRPLVYIGKLSYGIYLANGLSVAVFERYAHQAPLRTPLGLLWAAGLLAACAASYRWVEAPLRARLRPAAPAGPRVTEGGVMEEQVGDRGGAAGGVPVVASVAE